MLQTLTKEARLTEEAHRLYGLLKSVSKEDGSRGTYEDCWAAAPYTLSINQFKKEKNAVILAHSYTTPDLVYGVADYRGDSYELALKARDSSADMIVFAGVWFMAETAKILNPHKKVLVLWRTQLLGPKCSSCGRSIPVCQPCATLTAWRK